MTGDAGMMRDIFLGMIINAACTAALFFGGLVIARRRSRLCSVCLIILVVVPLVYFALALHGRLLLAQVLPFSNAIVLGNWILPGAGFLAGLLCGQRAIPPWRRGAFTLILAALACYSLFGTFHGRASPSLHSWSLDGMVLQSKQASCGPCCATTLLQACGIESTESEMMKLCLTTSKGTPSLGLYRGLKLKTRGTPCDVEVVRCDLAELCRQDRWPVLLLVKLEPSSHVPRQCGGPLRRPRNLKHAVVMFGLTRDGRPEIGDPAIPAEGQQYWTLDLLETRWRGEGLRLVPRASKSPNPGNPTLRSRPTTSRGLSRFSRSENGTVPFRNREGVLRPRPTAFLLGWELSHVNP